MKNPTTDDKIRVSWAINCALKHLESESVVFIDGRKTLNEVEIVAREFLNLFDKMIRDLPDEVCRSCGGTASRDAKGISKPIINGLHEECRTQEFVYKKKNL